MQSKQSEICLCADRLFLDLYLCTFTQKTMAQLFFMYKAVSSLPALKLKTETQRKKNNSSLDNTVYLLHSNHPRSLFSKCNFGVCI